MYITVFLFYGDLFLIYICVYICVCVCYMYICMYISIYVFMCELYQLCELDSGASVCKSSMGTVDIVNPVWLCV